MGTLEGKLRTALTSEATGLETWFQGASGMAEAGGLVTWCTLKFVCDIFIYFQVFKIVKQKKNF